MMNHDMRSYYVLGIISKVKINYLCKIKILLIARIQWQVIKIFLDPSLVTRLKCEPGHKILHRKFRHVHSGRPFIPTVRKALMNSEHKPEQLSLCHLMAWAAFRKTSLRNRLASQFLSCKRCFECFPFMIHIFRVGHFRGINSSLSVNKILAWFE